MNGWETNDFSLTRPWWQGVLPVTQLESMSLIRSSPGKKIEEAKEGDDEPAGRFQYFYAAV